MNWALLSIAGEGMLNAGNLLVEQCVLECLPPPVCAFSVFKKPTAEEVESIRATHCQFVLCTGTTLLTRRNSKFWQWAEVLEPFSMPVAMVGGCFWNAASDETDVIMPSATLLSVRDPYSLNVCQRSGYEYPMVGCPSLLVSESSAPPAVEGHIVVGFHRHGRCEQVIFFRKLALQKQRPLRILVQEVSERPAAALLAEETGGELIELAQLRSRADWQKVFVGASECISGRLHQVLPAAALGVPSLLILPDSTAAGDSRFSLLQHLGIPMQVLRTKEDEALLPKSANAPQLQQMVAALRGWLTDLQTDPQRLRTPRAIPASSDQYRDLEQRLRESITLGETLTDLSED